MKTLKIILTLTAILLMNSCGKSKVQGTTNPNQTTPNTNTGTGSSTAGTAWNSLDAIENSLQKLTMGVKTSTSFLYAYDEEEGDDMRYEYTAIDKDTVDVELFELEDDQVNSSFVLKREDILDNIFNRNGDYGRSRTMEIYPCYFASLYSNSGQGRALRAVQIVHTLESGESLIHVISPDVPAYANPLATAVSSSEKLWIFSARSIETKRIVRQIGNEFVSLQCQ